jgi:hypothetical protein
MFHSGGEGGNRGTGVVLPAVPGVNGIDNVQQLTLADLTINGRQRKVIMQATKGGIFYALDRSTGEFISAAPLRA